MKAERPTSWVIWIYACGQLGWSLTNYCISSLLSYFYLPPEEAGSKAVFPEFIPHTTLLGLTLLGLISFSGRFFDALIDPFVANLSDKSQNKWGKRKFFMAIASLPLALMTFLVFCPLSSEVGWFNTVWLTITVFLYYVFLALYMIPYSALISELGHVEKDRLKISMTISITWALGFLIGNGTPALQSYLESKGTPSVYAFQTAIGLFAVIALIFMLVPVLFLDEKRYAAQGISHENFRGSLKAVFRNRNYRFFSISYLLYWLSLTFIQSGIIYYVTLLMGLEKSMASLFGVVGFFVSFALYPLISLIVRKKGKKQTLIYAFWIFCVIFAIVLLPIPMTLRFWLVSILSSFPLAVFGILPNAIVADIVHDNERLTGENQAGMFYAVSAFMMKIGISLANLIFPSLLILGKSQDNPLGVQLSVIVALIICFLGYFVFTGYQDNFDKN